MFRRFTTIVILIDFVFAGLSNAQMIDYKKPDREFESGYGRNIEFSPDGKQLLIGGAGGFKTRLYDIESGRKIYEITHKSSDRGGGGATFAPHGRQFAVFGTDVTIYDVLTGEAIKTFASNSLSVLFSRDGKRLYIGAGDLIGQVTVIDTYTWETVAVLDQATRYTPFMIDLSPNGLLSITPDWPNHWYEDANLNEIQLFDAETLEPYRKLPGNVPPPTWREGTVASTFTPDGRYLLSGGVDEKVLVWDLETGQAVREMKGTQIIHDLDTTPDGRFVVAGESVSTGRIFDFETGETVRYFRATKTASNVMIDVSPDGRRIAAVGQEGTRAYIWNIDELYSTPETPVETPTAKPLPPTPTITPTATMTPTPYPTQKIYTLGKPGNETDPGIIYDLAFMPDGERIVTFDYKKRIIIWDKKTCGILQTIPFDIPYPEKMQVTQNGRHIWVGGHDNGKTKIIGFDMETGERFHELMLDSGYPRWELLPDETRLLYGATDRGVRLVDLSTGGVLGIYLDVDAYNEIGDVKRSPGGNEILASTWHWVTNHRDSRVSIIDFETGEIKEELLLHHRQADKVFWTEDGKNFFLGTFGYENGTILDHFLDYYDRETMSHLRRLELEIDQLAVSPDGRLVLAGDYPKKYHASLIDYFTGDIVATFIHPRFITAMEFSSDRTEVLTGTNNSGSDTAAARLWDISGIQLGPVPALEAFTPTPTMTPTPTATPDTPYNISPGYRLEELSANVRLLAVHPTTGDLVSASVFDQVSSRHIEFAVRPRDGEPSGYTITMADYPQDATRFFNYDNCHYSDMSISRDGTIYLIGSDLMEFVPGNVKNPVRKIQANGRALHVVTNGDRIANTEPGEVLILRTPDDQDYNYAGNLCSEIVKVDPKDGSPEMETVVPAQVFPRENPITDMAIGPEGRLFMLSNDPQKLLFLDDNGEIREFLHYILPIERNYLYDGITYNRTDRAFIISTWYDVWMLPIDGRSMSRLVANNSYNPNSFYQYPGNIAQGDALFFIHHKQYNNPVLFSLTSNGSSEIPTPTPTPSEPTATPTPIYAWFMLDGFGGIHSSNPEAKPPVLPYFVDYNIVRDIEPDPNGLGWYMLDGYGGIHRSSEALPKPVDLPYFGFDIARNLEIKDSGNGYLFYLLDGYGAIHTNDANFKFKQFPWFGKDVMRDLEPDPDRDDWLAMDERGTIYYNGEPKTDTFRFGHYYYISPIMRSLVRFGDGRTVGLDFWGGRHTNPYYPAVDEADAMPPELYFPGWDIIWDLEVVPHEE